MACSLATVQHVQAQRDTVSLAPVTVRGFAPERFMAGLKVQVPDSATLQQFRFQNITDLLAFQTPLAFRNYGPGQLATASFRGTSSNHTAVLWNGLNINQPNLGQTDFSTIPVASFDRLAVQYGTSASVVGTDAVGGSLLLSSAARQSPGLSLSAGRQQGSFHNYQNQLAANYATPLGEKWNFAGKTALYDGRMNNKYPYRERQNYLLNPSESEQRGLVQDLFFQDAGQRQQWSAHLWLTDNQLILAPANLGGRELTRTQSYRSMLQYEALGWTARTAWTRDLIDYGKGDFTYLEHTETDRFATRLEKEFTRYLGRRQSTPWSVRVGGEVAHYRTRTDGYVEPLITENRADLFVLSRWQATDRWLVSANLRQAFVTRFNPPLTPSVGTEYLWLRRPTYTLAAKASVGRNYRVPTLNERYWLNLGNPNLRPEHGWNKEAGLEAKWVPAPAQQLTASLTAYHNRVDDWTYWNPERNYYVENLQLVVARGLEAQSTWQGTWQRWQAGSQLGYAWVRSSQERAYTAYAQDILGKQLMHVPVHTGTFNAYVQRGRLRLTGRAQAVSRRYTTFDNSKYLAGFVLADVLAETTLHAHHWQGRLQAQVHNVLNTFYLNVNRYAMPGRSFSFNLLITYNSKTK
ncbi:TonB-dependent receptor plug domain-containing protein [Rhabdobacter roseus]